MKNKKLRLFVMACLSICALSFATACDGLGGDTSQSKDSGMPTQSSSSMEDSSRDEENSSMEDSSRDDESSSVEDSSGDEESSSMEDSSRDDESSSMEDSSGGDESSSMEESVPTDSSSEIDGSMGEDSVSSESSHSHVWDLATVTNYPECEKEGTVVYACECGATYEETIPALGHDIQWCVIGADEENAGFAEGVCIRCNESWEAEGEIVERVEPTEEKNGYVTYQYVLDGKEVVEKKTIELLRYNVIIHEYDDIRVIEWDNSQNAYLIEIECGKCGNKEQTYAYKDESLTQEPTCESPGYSIYVYEYENFDGKNTVIEEGYLKYDITALTNLHTLHCGQDTTSVKQGGRYEYNDKFAVALEERTLMWAEIEPATCTTYKVAVFSCGVCHEIVTIYLSGEHNIADARLQCKDATCTTAGYTYKVCADCGKNVKMDDINALGHDIQWCVIGVDEENAGFAEGVCIRCAESWEAEGEIVERVEPTEEKNGYVTYQYVLDGKEVVEKKTIELLHYNVIIHEYDDIRIIEWDNSQNAYLIEIECGKCGNKEQTYAYKDESLTQEPTCESPGYSIYVYEYENFDGKNTVIEEGYLKYDITAPTNIHTLHCGQDITSVKQGGWYEYNDKFAVALEERTLMWAETEPATCTTYKVAGFSCGVCHELVTIYLSGKHSLASDEVVTEAACTTRGVTTRTCTNATCNIEIVVSSVDALGHNYVADNASLSAFRANPVDGGSVIFNCECGDSIVLQAVLTKTVKQDRCVTIYRDTYTFTKTYAVESAVVGETISKTFTYTHVVDKRSGSHTLGEIKNLQQGGTYECNDKFAAAIEAGTLRWAVGEPSACIEHEVAGFDCTVCGNLVTINLSGEHTIDSALLQKRNVTCTTAGYTYKKCTACGIEIKIEDMDALGHKYVVDNASFSAFCENPVDGGSVIFNCECGDSIVLPAVLTKTIEQSGCSAIMRFTYTFMRQYYVESVNEGEVINKIFTCTHIVDEVFGSHTMGDIKNIENGASYDYNDTFATALEEGILMWVEGKPPMCSEYGIAGFYCSACDNLIIIYLSGEHDIADASLQFKAATCTTAGYTYKVCADCGKKVKMDDINALGHDIQWCVIGADEENAGFADGVCIRCHESWKAEGEIVERVEPTEGKNGYVIYKYLFDGKEVVERRKIVLS